METMLVGLVIMIAATHATPAPAPAISPIPLRVAVERSLISTPYPPLTLGRAQLQRPLTGGTLRGGRIPRVVIGALAGMIGGGFVGHEMTKDCACDSPGLAGLVYGMPIGAAIGALVGWNLSR